MTTSLLAFAEEPFCYLTTFGRRSGAAHTIEIWFATDGASLYLISGGGDRSDWVRNLQATPHCKVRVGGDHLSATARTPLPVGTERNHAVDLLHDKYGNQVTGSTADWQRDAFIVALDPTENP